MPLKRLNYIPNLLNNLNSPTPNAFTEPITGLPIPGSGLVVGDTMSMTYFEAAQLATQPGTPSLFPLYEGDYRFVKVASVTTPANAQRGYVAFLYQVPPSIIGTGPGGGQFGAYPTGEWQVTDASHAININLQTGVFINPISPGNFGFIQTAGRTSVLMATAATVGAAIYSTTTGQGTTVATFMPIGYAVTAAAIGAVAQVKLTDFFGTPY